MNMDKVSGILHDHYQMTFNDYGATSKGVDWGDKEWAALLRQRKMLEILKNRNFSTILDVGCGYGALADLIHKEKFNLKYCGIDVVEEMIREAKKRKCLISKWKLI